MTDLADRLARDLRAMVEAYDAESARSQQTDLGPSQIGSPCTRCLARAVLGCRVNARPDLDHWCANIGTAVHAWLELAAISENQRGERNGADDWRWWTEARVYPDNDLLPSGGSCDVFDLETRTVLDHKVVGETTRRKAKKYGPSLSYRRQAHLYGLGYGKTWAVTVEHVAIAYWPRGGRLRDLYVWTERYRPEIADEALERYRLIRGLALQHGAAILPQLPVDVDCFDCGGDASLTEANPTLPAFGSVTSKGSV